MPTGSTLWKWSTSRRTRWQHQTKTTKELIYIHQKYEKMTSQALPHLEKDGK